MPVIKRLSKNSGRRKMTPAQSYFPSPLGTIFLAGALALGFVIAVRNY